MRYIKSKETFLKLAKNIPVETKINEAFTNEITFGGSLIGRLINTSIRKIRIEKNLGKVDNLAKQFEEALKELLDGVLPEEDVFEQQKFYIYYLLMLIYEVVISGNTVQYKLARLLTAQQFASYSRSGGGSVNDSHNNTFNKLKKIFEAESSEEQDENIEDINVDELEGLVDRTILELKDSKIQEKEDLVRKLEGFREELLKIPPETEAETDEKSSEESTEDSGEKKEDEKEEEDTKPKSTFTSEFRKLISSYLSIIRRVSATDVDEKEKPTRKIGDIVAWKQVTGEDAGRIQYGQVTKIFDEDKVQLVKLVNGKPLGTAKFVLANKDLKSLLSFDEEKYSKMPEKEIDEVKSKASQARLAFYTFKNLKKEETTNKYQQEIKRLNELIEKSKNKTNEHFVSRNYSSFDRIFEAEVVAPKIDYKSIDTWSEITDAINSVKKANTEKFKSHVIFLNNLLEGKVDNEKNAEEVTKIMRSLGKSFLRIIKEKNPKLLEKEQTEVDKRVTNTANLMSQVALALLKLRGKDISKLKGENNKGIGVSVEKYLGAYQNMLNIVKKGLVNLNESSLITRYDYFRLIKEEAEEQTTEVTTSQDKPEENKQSETDQAQGSTDKKDDPVRVAWFKYFKEGDQNKWKFDPKELSNYKTKIEKGPIDVDINNFIQAQNESKLILEKGEPSLPKKDPMLSIIDIFGRAYSLYATKYIPSGRPGGRVSQKTLEEYEFIGTGKDERGADASKEGDYYMPGRGPWANVRVFEKWKKKVNSIISDPVYRVVLANVNFVSAAEKGKTADGNDTRQEKGRFDTNSNASNPYSKGSGISLMEFINKMLTLEGTFADAANAFTRKYFNIEWIKNDSDYPPQNTRPTPTSTDPKDKKPFFTTVIKNGFKAKKGAFYLLRVKYTLNGTQNEKWWITWVVQESASTDKFILRVQESDRPTKESMITPWFPGQDEMSLVRDGAPPTLPEIENSPNLDTFIIVMPNSREFENGRANIMIKKVTLNNGNWAIQNPVELTLVSIERKHILCNNFSNNRRVLDTPIVKSWTSSRKARTDKEISAADINAMNNFRF